METAVFARQASTVGLSDNDRQRIAGLLSDDPTRGDLIPGAGGARKFRFPKPGQGKRGGYRIVSYFAADDVPVFLLDVLDKGDRLNLSQTEKNQLKNEMGRIANDYRQAFKEKVRPLAGIAS